MGQSRKSLFTTFSVFPKFAFANYDCTLFLEDQDMNLLLHMQPAFLKPPLLRNVGGGDIAIDKDVFEIHLNTFLCMCLTELKPAKNLFCTFFPFQEN